MLELVLDVFKWMDVLWESATTNPGVTAVFVVGAVAVGLYIYERIGE
ncbi:MAG: hypothetical protein AVDCRST_MAG93-7478 [uncultured Chloroflexia bacterium]|uniref:Uncharacterized protein n=1 Tax=uncultured Chloroflexia bacterium TaxID=1672391 RepID=A0A6J4MHP1_9CHLR|nr:MAG: hypothetical protein AVDCRST_MAG93-7478 [uncultured Chloroflexia bacterium]